jgi:hypothetical protein
MLSFINRVFVSVLLGLMVFINPASAETMSLATSTTEAQKLGLPVIDNSTNGELRCESYIKTSPLKGTVSLGAESVIAGAELSLSISLTNQSERPLTNLDTYLLIVRQDGVAAGTIVEYATLEKGTTLVEKQTKEFSHTWTVPNNLPAGVYYPVLHSDENGLPMLGDSLTIDTAEGEQRFEVTAGETSAVSFNTSKSLLNKDSFSHGVSPLFIQDDLQNTVSVVLENDASVAKTIPLQWNQYANTVTEDDFRRNTKTELITLAAGEVKTVSYTIQNQPESALFVTATISDGQAKSILGFTLSKQGVDEIELLASGLSGVPEQDKNITMFACVRATSELNVTNATVLLTLKDGTGAVVQTHTYSGDVKGIATGVGKSFSLERAYQSLTLTTSISVDGAPAREYTQVYDCEALGIACPRSAEDMSFVDLLIQYKYMILALLALIIGVGAYLFRRRAPVVVVALLLGLSAVSALPATTEAKGVTWTADLGSGYSDYTLDTSVSYYATIRNQTAGNTLVSDGGTVAVGDVITIEVSPFSGSDISWVPEGSSGPYMYPSFGIVNPGVQRTGYFISGAGQPSNICSSANIALESSVSNICIGHGFWGSGGGDPSSCGYPYTIDTYGHFTPVSVAPPSYTISNTGTAGLSCNANGSQCTVTSPGTISSQISFAATTAKIYPYRTTFTPGECALSNYVMAVLENVVPAQVINFSISALGGGSACRYSDGAMTPNGTTQQIIDECALSASGGYRIGQDFDYAYVITTDPSSGYYTTCHNNQFINEGMCSNGIFSWDGQPVCNQAYPVCTTVNSPPNPPTITGPTTGNPNVSYGFTVTATDSDNDQIYYQVDWNNDGVSDQRLPSSGLVNSGTGQSANYSWATDGAKTFKARTVDSAGNLSATWTSHTITITTPAATADLKINGSDGPLSINQNTNATVSWSSTNAVSCSLYGADLVSGGGAVAPTGSVVVSAQNSDNYVLVCGTASDSVSLTVVNNLPPTADINIRVNGADWDNDSPANIFPGDFIYVNWSSTNTTSCTATGGGGFGTGNAISGTDNDVIEPVPGTSDTYIVSCTGPGGTTQSSFVVNTAQKPNFNKPLVSISSLGTFDPATATYASVNVYFSTSNNGGSVTKSNAPYLVELPGYTTQSGTIPSGLAPGPVGYSSTVTIPGPISFGTANVKVSIDTPISSNGSVDETTEGEADNTNTTALAVPPPDPGLSITADRTRLRNGETTIIRWNIATPYTGLVCEILGPGMSINPAAFTDNEPTQPIFAKSEYVLKCTVAGTTFQKSVFVETEGVIEEI